MIFLLFCYVFVLVLVVVGVGFCVLLGGWFLG